MDSAVVVAVTDERAPLLLNSPAAAPPSAETAYFDDEILPWRSDPHSFPPPTGAPPPPPTSADAADAAAAAVDCAKPPKPSDPKQRLVSLDVFRGLTVSLMILVDDAGGAFPSINHSPWFGVTLADFVMPLFLFSVGAAIALVCKKLPNKLSATKKVIVRTISLFVLGLVLQGGYFHGRNHLTYGVDIAQIRWLGILQRIAFGYLLAALSEIWLVNGILVDSSMSYMKKYYVQWMAAVLLTTLYIALILGLFVPSWMFEVPISSSTLSIQSYGTEIETVQCGLRGSFLPSCNAVGFIDRLFLGQSHLYHNPVYKRTKECSTNSPDYGPLPPNAPKWCLAPFDPEGLLSSLMAAVTCFAGLHFGHLIVHFKTHAQKLVFFSMTSLVFLLCGFIVQLLGMPLSKPLYTVSYMFLTAGVSGLLFTLLYYLVDVQQFRKPFILFQWMGMNALIVFVLAACELFPVFLQGFYWRSPENNLVNLTESFLQTILHSKSWGTMAFVMLEILFWCLAAGFLHKKGIFIKL